MASFVTTINDNQYVGDSLSTINNNYANLNTQSNVVITNTNSVSGNVIQKGTTVSNVSNFVYGTTLYNETGNGDEYPRNLSILNKWSDVYINPNKDPLRVAFTNDNYTRKAFLQGKIYTRNVGMAATSFYRLARFSDNTSPTPLEVIDTAAAEGNVNYSHGYNTIFQSFYILKPNITYNFGLQHWWPRTGAQDEGGIQINGWSKIGSDSWPKNTGNTYKYIYANDVSIGFPGTGVNIESYLKLTII
jgi:hypothetical protein